MKLRNVWPVLAALALTGIAISASAQERPYSSKIEPNVKISDAPKAYMDRCYFCHDFSVGPMLRGRGLDANYVKTLVRAGSRAMPQFRHTEISDAELAQITQYLATLDPAMNQAPASTGEIQAGDVTRGAAVFNVSCVTCHGPKGRGDGIVAATLQPPVKDFRGEESMKQSADQLRQIITDGKPGTAMPPWKSVLSGQDVEDVLAYILSLRK